MSIIRFDGRSTGLRPGETVLEGLLRDGHEVPHSCRAGACQSCLIRAVRGRPPESAQVGLNAARKAQGYFLGCLARPSEDLDVDLGGEALRRTRVTIASIERLSETVLGVLLEPEAEFEYRAGQFLTLIRDDGLSRSYSIASLPGRDRPIELHVRVLAGGLMSRWFAGGSPGPRGRGTGPRSRGRRAIASTFRDGKGKRSSWRGPGPGWLRSSGSSGTRSSTATRRP